MTAMHLAAAETATCAADAETVLLCLGLPDLAGVRAIGEDRTEHRAAAE